MTDGITLNPGTGGAVVDTELPSARGMQIQRVKLVLGAVDTDSGDVASGNPIPVSFAPPVGAAAFATAQVTVGTTAGQLAAARTGAPGTGRVSITVINNGTVPIFVGISGVLTTTGLQVPAGDAITINTTAAVFAISGSTGQSVGVLESF